MIMTAELNSHQRISYYTGVKLIRHHQNNNSGTSGNPTSGGNTSGGGFYQHHHQQQHFPPPPPHHPQQHPPLPHHHPGHYHLPCPTGPPHLQHPGRVLHLNNQHGPGQHHHQQHHGHHQYGPGGGSNQNTRLYTGSPLIRSSAFHSSSANAGGNHKRSIKHHHQNKSHHTSHSNQNGNRNGSINQQNHHSNQNIIGGSCSSGSSSSSSSNEHLNHLQSPSGSPIAPEKLDISPLKLSSSPPIHEEISSTSSLSSNNSSPGPQNSPSPSNVSSSSGTSASSGSADGNKDLDHFYFLEEHWKPSTDGTLSSNSNPGGDMIIMDMSSSVSSSSASSTQWTNSGSGPPSPSVPPTPNATLTMMVDQFFASGGGGGNDHNNFGGLVVDSNNNVVGGMQHPDFNEIASHPPFGDHSLLNQNSLSGFNYNSNIGVIGGSAGLFNYDGGKFTGNSRASPPSTTVVNVETQIGTFNGQRDLEIRLCFIKGDRGRENCGDEKRVDGITYNSLHGTENGVNSNKVATVIGDPFTSSNQPATVLDRNQESGSISSLSSSQSLDMKSDAGCTNKEVTQQS